LPFKDTYHDALIHALVKDGWTILREQYKLPVGTRRLWIDVHAAKAEQIILVEIKGFETSPSSVEELADALGQYVMYQVGLAANKITVPLYLAVPEAAYEGILSEELGRLIRQHSDMKLLVFDPNREVITKWNP